MNKHKDPDYHYSKLSKEQRKAVDEFEHWVDEYEGNLQSYKNARDDLAEQILESRKLAADAAAPHIEAINTLLFDVANICDMTAGTEAGSIHRYVTKAIEHLREVSVTIGNGPDC